MGKLILGQTDILIAIVKLLQKHKINFLLTGSFAVSYYGIPRATHDIDLIIEIEKRIESTDALSKLGHEYDIPSKNIITNPQTREFNIYHPDTGVKVDFWRMPKSQFNQEYQRKKVIKIGKILVPIVSAEGLILTKLAWCKVVFSQRHFDDCVGISRVQKVKLDIKHLKEKAKQQDIEALLNQLIL